MRQRPREGPVPDPDREAIHLIRRLSREDFGSSAAMITESGEILPPSSVGEKTGT
jgi:hypothetical protein